MNQKLINEVVQGMLGSLNNAQLERLQDVLKHALFKNLKNLTGSFENAVLSLR